MRVVSLSFPGRFEDAFLYMGRLFTITENHSVRVYDMSHIVNIPQDKALSDVLTHLFFRNDKLDTKDFHNRLNDESEKRDFLNTVDRLEAEQLQINSQNAHPVEWDLKISADILLDLNIYNGRAYIGTNKGLYHLDLDWESEIIKPITEAKKRLDAKCFHTTAKYGTVNASCGSEGWFSFLDDFDLGIENTHKEKHILEPSLRTNWLDYDIVNYPTSISPTLFASVRIASQEISASKKSPNFEQERWIVTDFEDEDKNFDLASLFATSKSGYKLCLENLQFVHNSSQALFLSTYDGKLFALGLKMHGSSIPTASYIREYEGLSSLISSLHTIYSGNKGLVVLETDEQVLLFAGGKFIPIYDDEVISIRTFSRSKYYRNIVSITTANEVLLIAIFDDDIYSSPYNK